MHHRSGERLLLLRDKGLHEGRLLLSRKVSHHCSGDLCFLLDGEGLRSRRGNRPLLLGRKSLHEGPLLLSGKVSHHCSGDLRLLLGGEGLRSRSGELLLLLSGEVLHVLYRLYGIGEINPFGNLLLSHGAFFSFLPLSPADYFIL